MRNNSGKKQIASGKRNRLLKFPGGEIIGKGLNDILHHKNKTIEALIVYTASPRLNELGFHIDINAFVYPHLLLYERLKKKYNDSAYSQYRALMNGQQNFVIIISLEVRAD